MNIFEANNAFYPFALHWHPGLDLVRQRSSTIPGAAFGTLTIGGVVKTTVTYSLTDGGAFDGDGVANGVIQDPVGIATVVAGAPNTGLGTASPSGGLNLALAALSLMMVMLGCAWRQFSRPTGLRRC